MSRKTKNTAALLIAITGLFLSASLAAAESEDYDAAAGYQATCYACHGTGQAHAPVVGDVIEWEIRLDKGMDTLIQNTINGLNGMMPPRGLCADCSDEQLKAIVEYMLEESK